MDSIVGISELRTQEEQPVETHPPWKLISASDAKAKEKSRGRMLGQRRALQ